MTNKEYKINKLIDILKIPEDRLDTFLSELKPWVEMTRATLNLLDACAESIGQKMPEQETGMNWIDDGEKKITIKINAGSKQ